MILVVDDEPTIRSTVTNFLARRQYSVTPVSRGQDALEELKLRQYDLALIDYKMPPMDGLELLEQIMQVPGHPPVVFMSGFGSVETAVEAMRRGAVDYISKPFNPHELLHVIERNLRSRELEMEVQDLRKRLDARDRVDEDGIVAESAVMKGIVAMAAQVAATPMPVLIDGETGTGKELLARLIHRNSPRALRPFVAVNCGALHPELLLSELFGHKRGAFTGAVEDRAGRFELANGGTIFLDEIGDLELSAQTKLLRVLQEKTFERLGDHRTVTVDVRVVAATNRKLETMVDEQTFRRDLYYRLAVMTLRVPPLRERPEDILPLAEHYLQRYSEEAGRVGLEWSSEARQLLVSSPWTGNVRELQNAVQRAVVITPRGETLVGPESFAITRRPGNGLVDNAVDELWTLEELECEYLKRLLKRPDLRMSDICKALQIDATTLWRKRKKFGL